MFDGKNIWCRLNSPLRNLKVNPLMFQITPAAAHWSRHCYLLRPRQDTRRRGKHSWVCWHADCDWIDATENILILQICTCMYMYIHIYIIRIMYIYIYMIIYIIRIIHIYMIIYIYVMHIYIYMYVYIPVCMFFESDMQYRWYYYTSPQQYSHCWSSISILGVMVFHCSRFSARGRRIWIYIILVVLYHCFILVEENCFDSTMVKWV